MPDPGSLKEIARRNARLALGSSASFHQLSLEEQKNMFADVYRANYDDLARSEGLVEAQAGRRSDRAGDLIDDERHLNPRIEQAGELAGEFVDEVDFPGFVKDLLEAVFDANLEVTLTQMKAYQDLLKTATQSVAKFVNAIDDTAAFGYLAENQGDDFNIDFSDTEQEQDGTPKGVLTNKEGEPLDLGDNEVKAKIMDAKIAMAKEQRMLLRESILMGVTRLVVEEGNVKASVLFNIKAGEKIQKTDKAALKDSVSSSRSISASGGLIGKMFGGPSGGHTRSRRKTKISVASAKSQAETDLQAKLAGSVDIKFKSDYFKLDNFANLFGQVSEADRAEAGGGSNAPNAPTGGGPAR